MFEALFRGLSQKTVDSRQGMLFDFFGGERTKITFDGDIGQEANYRLVWDASGINKYYVISTPENNKS